MVLEFACDDGLPCWFYSLIVDDFGFEWSCFNGDFDYEQVWYFIESEQEH